MTQNPVPISDREKEFKTLKSRIPPNLTFDGVINCTRKDYIKHNRKITDIFELSFESNLQKSGDWNYIDSVVQDDTTSKWKEAPFDAKPNISDHVENTNYMKG